MSVTNQGDILCDGPCDGTFWDPAGYAELWPKEIRGPWGPDRVFDPGYHICLECLRKAFTGLRARQLAEMASVNARLRRARWAPGCRSASPRWMTPTTASTGSRQNFLLTAALVLTFRAR